MMLVIVRGQQKLSRCSGVNLPSSNDGIMQRAWRVPVQSLACPATSTVELLTVVLSVAKKNRWSFHPARNLCHRICLRLDNLGRQNVFVFIRTTMAFFLYCASAPTNNRGGAARHYGSGCGERHQAGSYISPTHPHQADQTGLAKPCSL